MSVDGIRIGVLRDEAGYVGAPSPLGAVTTLLVGELRRTASALLADAAPLLAHDERTALEALRDTGEWAELADALVARLVDVPDLPGTPHGPGRAAPDGRRPPRRPAAPT